MNLAPEFLHQTINPWSFSLFNFTKQIKGSSELEYKILTEIAGYGSQIGNITDFIEVLEKMCLDPDKLKDLEEKDKIKYYKFKDMVQKIHDIKKKI